MALLSLATLQLVKILLANNKIQDIDKIYNDIQYRNKLMEEYKIYEEDIKRPPIWAVTFLKRED